VRINAKVGLAACGLLLFAAPAAAQAPVAIVEDVTGAPSGVEFMDYVAAGKVIRLGPAETIVLGYIKSCWRETITGGTITVGAEQSEVVASKVERAKVGCDASKIRLTSQQADKSGAMVFRERPRPGKTSQPELTLYGLSPLVDARGGGTLVIERLDQPGERHEVAIGGALLVRGAFYDFAKAGKELTAGGIYRASVGAQQIVFKVDPRAKAGQAPIIGRLLRFHPAG